VRELATAVRALLRVQVMRVHPSAAQAELVRWGLGRRSWLDAGCPVGHSRAVLCHPTIAAAFAEALGAGFSVHPMADS